MPYCRMLGIVVIGEEEGGGREKGEEDGSMEEGRRGNYGSWRGEGVITNYMVVGAMLEYLATKS